MSETLENQCAIPEIDYTKSETYEKMVNLDTLVNLKNLADKCKEEPEHLRNLREAKEAYEILSTLNWKLNNENNDFLNSIDLKFDNNTKNYKFRLFNNNSLVLDLKLDHSQLEEIWNILVDLINNIDDLKYNWWNSTLHWAEFDSFIWKSKILGFWTEVIVWVEQIKKIFGMEESSWYNTKKSMQMVMNLRDFINEAKNYKEEYIKKWIKTEKIN